MKKAIVMWSGGKDCNLALFLSRKEFEITALITFHSPQTEFRAHPKEWMNLQSRALGIPHLLFELQEPFDTNAEIQLEKLKKQTGAETIVSGDISLIHGNSNWINERAEKAGMNCFLPLWDINREEALEKLLDEKFEVILTMVKEPWFDNTFVGRRIDHELINEFKFRHEKEQLDLCGENGEYHTMVVDGPGYKSKIDIHAFEVVQHQEMFHFSNLKISTRTLLPEPILEKAKQCVNCGLDFSCYSNGCWCADLPMIMPMENITDCLCPTCLKAAINDKLVSENRDPID